MSEQTFWRRCSNCKAPIGLGARYWVCSVSTCQRVRAPLQYCKVTCFDVHNEIENHKDAWALERTAPLVPDAAEANTAPPRPVPSSSAPTASAERRVVRDAPSSTPSPAAGPVSLSDDAPHEILVVVSRLKAYIKARSDGMNTSDEIMGPLSDHLRKLVDEGIANAARAGRKTVMARDLRKP